MRRFAFFCASIACFCAIIRIAGFDSDGSIGSITITASEVVGTSFAGWLGIECLGKAMR
jgi:hypothetical protein